MTANDGPQVSESVATDESTAREKVGWLPRSARWAENAVTFLVVTVFIFALMEGAASSVIFLKHLLEDQEGVWITEQRHTMYDPELGWVSVPDVFIPDLYGEGKELTTNNRGFRGEVDVQVTAPPGKRRVLCSGDSFTLGHGVSNDDSWCAQLAALDPSIESVNMGQGGYGVGQAFLWYQRDGADLERVAHILAFIGDDFFRMQRDHFLGFAKPVLELEGNRLVVKNTPVPRRSVVVRWLAQNGALFHELRSVQLLGAIKQRLWGGAPGDGAGTTADETWRVATAVFDSLAHENAARGSKFVLLFLPTPWDYDTNLYDGWRRRAHEFSESTGVPLIDMIEELRALDEEEASGMFIPLGEEGAPHLNELGNRWVAHHLLDWGLTPMPGPTPPRGR